MYTDEAETQARRRILATLQDETRMILDAARGLSLAYNSMLGGKSTNLKVHFDAINKSEEEVQGIRRFVTRSLAEIGSMLMNREDLLRTAYAIEGIAAYIASVSFKLSQVRVQILKSASLGKDIGELLDMNVEAVQRLNEIVRALAINPSHAIELAYSVQKVERQTDEKYRSILAKIMKEVTSFKDLIVLKDIIEGMENMSDRCLAASDSITILALGL